MPRADLLALTESGLTQLANAGLVKRGLKDMAADNRPSIAELADGTIEGIFADGTVTRLPAAALPDAAHCTCPSGGMCRHRVLLVLAYQADCAEPATASAANSSWDPATLDGEAFEAALSGPARTELTRLLAAPLVIQLTRGAVPSANLPMANVRFLVPDEIGYAQCDCATGRFCAHVAVAVRAFKAAAGTAEVTLGATPSAAVPDGLIAAVDAVLAGLLRDGVVAGMAAHGRALDRAAASAAAIGATWLVLALEALSEQVSGYEARSALYHELTVLELATELYARPRARNRDAALGIGEPMETPMGKTRLVSLGARVIRQGRDLSASVLLADTDTGSVMRLAKRFSPANDYERLTAWQIADRPLVPGLPLGSLARGQILTAIARRRADGMLALGQGSRGRTSLMPRGQIQALPSPLQLDGVGSLLTDVTARAPRFLLPRNAVRDVHVFAVATFLGQSWRPGNQQWQAAATLADGGTLYLERRHDPGAPAALPVLFAAGSGAYGPIRHVAGTVRVIGDAVICEPWLLASDQVVVPDLDIPERPAEIATVGEAQQPTDLELTAHLLAGALHAGRRVQDRDPTLMKRLAAIGYEALAQRLRQWSSASDADQVRCFGESAIWLSALVEA